MWGRRMVLLGRLTLPASLSSFQTEFMAQMDGSCRYTPSIGVLCRSSIVVPDACPANRRCKNALQ